LKTCRNKLAAPPARLPSPETQTEIKKQQIEHVNKNEIRNGLRNESAGTSTLQTDKFKQTTKPAPEPEKSVTRKTCCPETDQRKEHSSYSRQIAADLQTDCPKIAHFPNDLPETNHIPGTPLLLLSLLLQVQRFASLKTQQKQSPFLKFPWYTRGLEMRIISPC